MSLSVHHNQIFVATAFHCADLMPAMLLYITKVKMWDWILMCVLNMTELGSQAWQVLGSWYGTFVNPNSKSNQFSDHYRLRLNFYQRYLWKASGQVSRDNKNNKWILLWNHHVIKDQNKQGMIKFITNSFIKSILKRYTEPFRVKNILHSALRKKN